MWLQKSVHSFTVETERCNKRWFCVLEELSDSMTEPPDRRSSS